MPRLMFKYRLYPSKTQTKVLEEQLELCRLTHNRLLDYCKLQYKEKGNTPSQFDLNNHLIALKQLKPEFSRIYSQVLQNIAKRIKDRLDEKKRKSAEKRRGRKPPKEQRKK